MISEELRNKFIEKAKERGEARAKAELADLEFSQIRDQLYTDFNSDQGDQERIKKKKQFDELEETIDSIKEESEEKKSEPYEDTAKQEETKESEDEEKVVLIDIQNPPEDLPHSSKSVTIDEAIEWMDKMPDEDKKDWAEGDTRLGILRYLGYSEEEIEEIRSKDDEPDEEESEDKEEESSESAETSDKPSSPPPPPPPPKPSGKTPPPPSSLNKEESKGEKKSENKTENPKNNDSLRVELPEGVVRPEGSPECFGNEEIYDPESKKCLTCIYDYECKEAIEAQE